MNKVKYNKEQLQEYLSKTQETPYYFTYFIIGFACFISMVFISGFAEFNNLIESAILLFLIVVSVVIFVLAVLFKDLLKKNLDRNIGIISICYALAFEVYFSSVFTDSLFNFFIVLLFLQVIKIILFLLVRHIMICSIKKNKKSSVISCSIATICGIFIAKSVERIVTFDTAFLMFSMIAILMLNLMYLFIVKGQLKRALDI
ncbi:MAG: hypothetical protein IKK46_07360 [Clostridia bacterium]|nr:hypothetical protein [Clostridia bacterium]